MVSGAAGPATAGSLQATHPGDGTTQYPLDGLGSVTATAGSSMLATATKTLLTGVFYQDGAGAGLSSSVTIRTHGGVTLFTITLFAADGPRFLQFGRDGFEVPSGFNFTVDDTDVQVTVLFRPIWL